jgi:hypothetical protein
MLASRNNNNGAVSPSPHALSFFVGQDRAGRWVVVEPHGLAGGIFVNRKAALSYAAFESDRRPGAVTLAKECLDLPL